MIRIRRLGLALDDDPLFPALVAAAAAAARDLGLTPVDVTVPSDEATVDAVLIIGRPGRHLALLATRPTRPRIVWGGEPLEGSTGPGRGPAPVAMSTAARGD